MSKVNLLKNEDLTAIPVHQTEQSAGVDIRSIEAGVLKPGEYRLFKTGLKVKIPTGYEIQVRPRSGLSHKFGITVLNSPGTIDSDYTGDIGIILINQGTEDFKVNKGDRIAQLVLSKYERISFNIVDSLEETGRSEGGFGSTGV